MLLLLGTAARAQDAQELVAIVDLKFIKATDRAASVMCFGEKEEDCGVWATHNLYKATIRKIISGSESRKTLLVLFGRHALAEMDLRRVIARMRPLEPGDEYGAQYQIFESGEKRELFCFRRWQDETGGLELKAQDEQSQTCYDPKSREDNVG